MEFINGPTAPPVTITITRDEYDSIKRDIAELFECHHMLRQAHRILSGVETDPVNIQDFNMTLAHYLRDKNHG